MRNADALASRSPCLVNVQAADTEVLGVALYNKAGTVAARMLSDFAYQQVDVAFFAERLRRCLAYRESFFSDPFYRLAHAEADGLPGLVIDRYGDIVCLQPSAAGLDTLLWPIADALEEVLSPSVVVVRADSRGRRGEGASVQREVLKGQYRGPTELRENGVNFLVDVLGGQKTGWYYDLRDQRALLATLAPRTPRVLDVYSYSGAFGVTLAQYGADDVVCVDSSDSALHLCRQAAALNAVGERVQTVRADAMEFLEGDHNGPYDLVIVDPPNLGGDRSAAHKAIRFYERLIRAASGACASPGLLFVASCTYHVGERDLLDAVSRGLRWAGRQGRVAAAGGQAADHPGLPALPESRYLHTLLLHLD